MSETPTEAQPNLAEQFARMKRDRNEWRLFACGALIIACLCVAAIGYLRVSSSSAPETPSPTTYSLNLTICGKSQMSASGATGYQTTHGFVVVPDSLAQTTLSTGTALNVTYHNVVTGPYAGYFVATKLASPTGSAPACAPPLGNPFA